MKYKIIIFDFGLVLVLKIAAFIINIFGHLQSIFWTHGWSAFSIQNHMKCSLKLGEQAMKDIEMGSGFMFFKKKPLFL